jgi:FlaG/FlaF family flagellin (archaellin)
MSVRTIFRIVMIALAVVLAAVGVHFTSLPYHE